MSKNIILLGCPSDLGGADTEAWHAIQMFQSEGYMVYVLPTWWDGDRWMGPPGWQQKLELNTFKILHGRPGQLDKIPELRGSIVISYCNSNFFEVLPELTSLGCKTIWLNCMTFMFDGEAVFEHVQPDAVIMQSRHQQKSLLKAWADKLPPKASAALEARSSVIRGAFINDATAFKPRPHAEGTIFTFGRMARPDPDKWSSNTWKIYSSVQYHRKAAVVMGADSRVLEKLGEPPEFVGCLPVNAIPVPTYLAGLHCLLPINGGAGENWPRAGLEAFAAGVPVVAQRAWGWTEMICHGDTGFLADNDEELAHFTAMLAYNEQMRVRILRAARAALQEKFSNSRYNKKLWTDLFEKISS